MRAEIPARSAVELVAQIRKREVTATDVVRASIARIGLLNPLLNAICTFNETAEGEAAECDRRLNVGGLVRALEGVPFVVKDVIETAGIRTTFGSKVYEDHIPAEDAISVKRLRAAGAILIGKTNTPEFAHDVNTTNRIFGTTRNPWSLNATSGGSSGGTAAAVAAGLAPIGLGTDLGGSVRDPASFCGIVGLRPAPGRVPIYPAPFGWDTLVAHVQGPMTRTVADAGLMLAVLAGPDDRDPSSLPSHGYDYASAARGERDLSGLRVAYSRDISGLVPVDREVAILTEDAARRFEELGCIVEEDCFDVSHVRQIIAGTRAFGMIARYADLLDASEELMTPQLIRQITSALAFDVRTIARAERMRTTYWQRVRVFLEKYDYIMTPTVGTSAFRLDRPFPTVIGGVEIKDFYDIFLATYAFSITGLPAISVPCGFNREGLPVGLQIVGRRFREDSVLAAAAAYASACPQHFRSPVIDPDSAKEQLHLDVSFPGYHIGR